MQILFVMHFPGWIIIIFQSEWSAKQFSTDKWYTLVYYNEQLVVLHFFGLEIIIF